MILMTYRHGLRAAEVTDLKWEQVDFDRAEIHINRLKGGMPATHPLTGRELRELRRLKREITPSSRFVFVSERAAPLSSEGFNRMVKRAGAAANLGIKVHAHMLRHACGFKLANDGIDTRTLQAYFSAVVRSTRRHAALAPGRFKNIRGKG
jgi:integrase